MTYSICKCEHCEGVHFIEHEIACSIDNCSCPRFDNGDSGRKLDRERERCGVDRERPIIFGTESVCAIRAGRKTQTRRVIVPQSNGHHWEALPGAALA